MSNIINPDAIRSYIQWLGLVNDGRMESDRGLVRVKTSCDLVKKYVSTDGLLEADYSCGMLVWFTLGDTWVYVHQETDDNGDPCHVTFDVSDLTRHDNEQTYDYLV